MTLNPDNLPDDPAALKALLLQQQSAYQEQITLLQEQLYIMKHHRFGASSEKQSVDQLGLFNEAEQDQPDEEQVTVIEQAESALSQGAPDSPERKKRGRKPLPEGLPRVRVEHDLLPEEKICQDCGNTDLHRIGEEVSEQLEIIPAKVHVLQHIRPKYGCRCCDSSPITVSMPPQPIPGSIASPSLLAQVIVGKYQDGLPLNRMEQVLQRAGMTLARSTLSHWMIRSGTLIQPLVNLLRDKLLSSDLVHCDETPVQVLKEPDRPAQSQSYMWVQVSRATSEPVVLFDYDPSRSGSVPSALLAGYQGYLQADGYEGYSAIGSQPGVILQGCWAHARRKFDEAIKAQGQSTKGKPPKAGKAQMGLSYIQKLYRIEQEIKDLTSDEKYDARQQRSQKILKDLRSWLEKVYPQTPPKTALGKALTYLHNQWDKLVRYCEAGYLRMDNNLAENAIRPFVIGRKNWLFSTSQAGAHASANLYSLIETAKANGLEPWEYMVEVMTHLPAADSVEKVEALLPWNQLTKK